MPNLAEFAFGGNPLGPDATNAFLQCFPYPGENLVVSYRVRQNLGDASLIFETSSNLLDWSSVTPYQTTTIANLGLVYVRDAFFTGNIPASFFRIRVQLNPAD